MSSPPRDRDRTNQVYVGHLPFRASEKDVEHDFEQFGKIRNISIKKGFAFIVSSPSNPIIDLR